MLTLLAGPKRVPVRDVTAQLNCSQEELLIALEPLIEDGLAVCCLNISGGPNWIEITAHGQQVLADAEAPSI